MQKFILSVTLIAACAVIVSCENEHAPVDNEGMVRFTSGATAAQTRVAIDPQGKSVWEKDDPVGIYMVKHGTKVVAEGADNIEYKASTAGESTSFASASTAVYYPKDETARVDFIAYYPYNAAVSGFGYRVDVSNQASQTAIDLMWASADKQGTGYNKEDARQGVAVNFTFTHQLAKLIMNVTKDASVSGNVTAVSINHMCYLATYYLAENNLAIGIDVMSFAPCTVTPGALYEAILLPISLNTDHTVTFTTDQGETFTWDMSKQISELKPGKIYTYDVTIMKYTVEATGSIAPWTVGSIGKGTAE
ncbi:MAG: Putative fimbrium subunit Fim1C [Parabacteroides sp.]